MAAIRERDRAGHASLRDSGYEAADHFNAPVNMVTLGSGAQRKINDVHLSRYACYLVVQNADPSKEIVALGQTYCAVQTRRQEMADELAGLTDAQRRLYLRGQVTLHNRSTTDALATSNCGLSVSSDRHCSHTTSMSRASPIR